jgi:hypothetical protein
MKPLNLARPCSPRPRRTGQTGAIELDTDGKGDRNRLERKGRTKEIVKDKLGKDVAGLESRYQHQRQLHG